MCDCPNCKANREKLTPEQLTTLKGGIDALFTRMLPGLPTSIAVCVHATLQTSVEALARVTPTSSDLDLTFDAFVNSVMETQLRALAVTYGAYWALADALREETVLYLREKLKAATPTLMKDVRDALERVAPVVVAMMKTSDHPADAPPVDRTKLN